MKGALQQSRRRSFAEGGEQSSRGASSFEQPTCDIRKALPSIVGYAVAAPHYDHAPGNKCLGWILLFGQMGWIYLTWIGPFSLRAAIKRRLTGQAFGAQTFDKCSGYLALTGALADRRTSGKFPLPEYCITDHAV